MKAQHILNACYDMPTKSDMLMFINMSIQAFHLGDVSHDDDTWDVDIIDVNDQASLNHDEAAI